MNLMTEVRILVYYFKIKIIEYALRSVNSFSKLKAPRSKKIICTLIWKKSDEKEVLKCSDPQ